MIKNYNIKLAKLDRQQIEILHRELQLYSVDIYHNHLKTNFLDALVVLDIINNLYFKLRNKLETQKQCFTASFSISQAAVVQKMILSNENKCPLTVATLEKIKTTIHQQFINLNV